MDDPEAVGFIEGTKDVERKFEDVDLKERASSCQHLADREAVDELHDDVGEFTIDAVVSDADAVLALERRDSLGLPMESGNGLRIGRMLRLEDLHGIGERLDARVRRHKDPPERALAEHALDSVLAVNQVADLVRRKRC